MLNLQKHGGAKAEEKALSDIQNTKKILRALNEYSTRVDELSGKCRNVEELFSPALVGYRGKIRDYVVMSIKSSSQGLLGILDLSWRKGSYEVLQIARRLKKDQDWSEIESAFIQSHLDSCCGFYHQLLMSFQSSLDFANLRAPYGFLGEEEEKMPAKEDGDKDAKAVYKCLVFLGDLMRYKIELSASTEKTFIIGISKKYYHQALAVDPHQGQPYNQLAALSGSQCQGLVGIYYYLRSLTSENKFEAAEANLKKILDKSASQDVKNKEEKKVAKNLAILLQDLIFEESTKNLSNICRQALESLMNLLYSQHPEKSSIISQVSTYGILSLFLAKERVADGKSAKKSMIDAFLLAWFTHLTTKILADLYFNLFGPDAMSEIFQPKEVTKKNDEIIEVVENGKNVKPKKGDLRRRRKKLIHDSDSENEENDNSNEEDDDDDEDDDDSGSFQFNSDSENDEDLDIVIEETEDIISVRDVMKLFQNHTMLESFQLCCYWLMASERIIKDSGENSDILWTRLALLLNTLSLNNDKYQKDSDLNKIKVNSKWAFSEDKISRGIKMLHHRHKLLDFTNENQLGKDELGLARLHQIEELKKWLCKLPNFSMNEDKIEFSSKAVDVILDEKNEKAQLMENMAHLWLQQEVKDLEGHEDAGAKGKFSLYIIVDHTAMVNHMPTIQDIVATKRFAIVVPTAVIQYLDSMKKSDGRARNAIRWLERQFQNGNNWLRGQKSHEAKTLSSVKYPQKREKEAWTFFKILDCCNHFLGLAQGYGAATLLTTSSQDPDLIETAKKVAVNVETVEEFVAKCKIPKKVGNRAFPRKRVKDNG